MAEDRRRHRRAVRRSASGDDVTSPRAADEVLPTRAAEDSDSAWGDAPDSNDRRLRDDVPPHW